jgi:hypothetical protein
MDGHGVSAYQSCTTGDDMVVWAPEKAGVELVRAEGLEVSMVLMMIMIMVMMMMMMMMVMVMVMVMMWW